MSPRPLADTRLLRFAAVGVTNTAVSGLAFWAAHTLLEPLSGAAAAAQTLAYAVGILWSYTWNRTWTFGDRGAVHRTLPAFVAVQLALLAGSAGLMGLSVDILEQPALPSWLAVMALVTLTNYTALRTWVFGRSEA